MTVSWLKIFALCLMLFSALPSCVTAPMPPQIISLEQALADPQLTPIDYEVSSQGLIIITVQFKDTGASKFILDTGATTSAIYRSELSLELQDENIRDMSETASNAEAEVAQKFVRVHDMHSSKLLSTVKLKSVSLGAIHIQDLEVVVLDKPPYQDPLLQQVKGIVGLDVISGYSLLLDSRAHQLTLLKAQPMPMRLDESWKHVPLTQTPFEQDAFGLYFMTVLINGRLTHALLDTGSDFNVMNWNFKHLWQLTVRRGRLLKEWQLSGALGEFDPQGAAILEGIQSADFTWPRQTFSVFDIEPFEASGFKDKPIMLAGMPFFSGRTVLIDFPHASLWMKDEPKIQ